MLKLLSKIKKPFFLFSSLLLILVCLSGCNEGYQKENGVWYWVYYNEAVGKGMIKIDSADAETFIVLKDKNYAVDKKNVFYKAKRIAKANPKTFTTINNKGYSKDDKKVFLNYDELIFADPNTFEILDFPYSKDKNTIFCGTIPVKLPPDEINQFKVTKVDRLMSEVCTCMLKKDFVKQNPDFKWLDSIDVEGVTTYEFATGATHTKKIKGFRVITSDK